MSSAPVLLRRAPQRRDTEAVMPLELFFDLVFVLAITQTTALMAHDRWAIRAEHPLSSVAVMHAARVMQRSYQAILAEVAATDRATV